MDTFIFFHFLSCDYKFTYDFLWAIVPPGLYERYLHAVRDGPHVFWWRLGERSKYRHHAFSWEESMTCGPWYHDTWYPPRSWQVFNSAVKVSSGGIVTVSGESSISGKMSLEMILSNSLPSLQIVESARFWSDKRREDRWTWEAELTSRETQILPLLLLLHCCSLNIHLRSYTLLLTLIKTSLVLSK